MTIENKAKALTIVIPCYNEAENIPNTIPEVLKFAEANEFAVVIVNDGSKDDSFKLLKQYTNNRYLKIINNKVNKGYGGAIKEGIKVTESDYSIIIDADGQHYLEDVKKLYEKILINDADMIVGSRKHSGRSISYRGIGKSIIRNFAKLLMPIHIYDINSGMKIFRTDLAKKYLYLMPDTMAFSDVFALVFINSRYLVLEEPIQIKPRKAGQSTININTAFRTVMEIINILALFNPLKIFLPFALTLIIIGIAWSMRSFLLGHGVSTGGALLITSGILSFLIGLIAEQLAQIRKNMKNEN